MKAFTMSVADDEMNEILSDKDLVKNLRSGLKDLKSSDYEII